MGEFYLTTQIPSNKYDLEDCEFCAQSKSYCTYHQGFVDGWVALTQKVMHTLEVE